MHEIMAWGFIYAGIVVGSGVLALIVIIMMRGEK